ncbi:serine hydrolase [Lewinella sp. W8]|uniref:serine hydrolase domain-containing protein n=1 Tax=Lewinella sp. W8 TaxID=2528208 RepID=UPI001067F339|nr:serine hydrolase domain-containing protein [Lewinella sp. W8]MTB50861.1 serine hydrolase [Lewinella sp. W8]
MRYLLMAMVLIAFCSRCHKNPSKSPGLYTSDTEYISLVNSIDSLVHQLVKDQHTAGISFGIQRAGGKPFFRSYGMADIEHAVPVKASSLFNVASVSKPFTAIAVGILIDRQQLSLETKIDEFFPDFPLGGHITIYQLMSHTSGIPDWWMGGLPDSISTNWTVDPNPHLVLQQMQTTSLFDPGTKHFYSNSGYLLLGEIIEKISGKEYREFMEEELLHQFGANDSFIEEKGMKRDSLWTWGYGTNITDSTSNSKQFFKHDFNAYSLKSFGGLKSTPKDLLSICHNFFSGQILEKATVTKMLEYATTTNGNFVYDELFVPEGFPPPQLPPHISRNGYGLGFSLMSLYDKPVIWHSGGMPGYNAILVHFPESETTLVILSNTDNGIIPEYEGIMRIASQIEKETNGK